jgi:hypothetical protein
MAEIKVRCSTGDDYMVTVDDADFEWLNAKDWFDSQGYACTTSGPKHINGMHRLIMGVTDSTVIVDHENGNRSDYRRENLRLRTKSQNHKNKRIPLEKTEEPGIFWDGFKKRFTVILYHPETENRFFFGAYKTLEKAIPVRDAEMKHGGYKHTRSPRSWDKLPPNANGKGAGGYTPQPPPADRAVD